MQPQKYKTVTVLGKQRPCKLKMWANKKDIETNQCKANYCHLWRELEVCVPREPLVSSFGECLAGDEEGATSAARTEIIRALNYLAN